MTTAIQRTFFTPTDFPESQIREVIKNFFDHEAETLSPLYDHTSADGSSLGVSRPTIDSYVVVELLVELEPICQFPLPESIVRQGGYDSVDELEEDFLPKLKNRWQRSQT